MKSHPLPSFTRLRSLPLALLTSSLLVAAGCAPTEPEVTSEAPLSVEEASQTIAGASTPGASTPGTSNPGTSNPGALELSKLPQQPPAQPKVFELGLFASDELFAAGGGGCGMSLRPSANVTEQQGDLLFHGLDDAPMLMKINGEIVPFKLDEGRGPEFYGQTPSQTFSNRELDIIAVVDVEVGEKGETESVKIPSGSIFLQGKSSNIQIPVEGDVGC